MYAGGPVLQQPLASSRARLRHVVKEVLVAVTVDIIADLNGEDAGDVVHLRILPGDIEDYAALVRRALPAA